MRIRYLGGEGPNDPDPNDPDFADLTPEERDALWDELLWSDLDMSMWDTIELALEEVMAAAYHDRAAQIMLHTAAASRLRAQIYALRARIAAIDDLFTANNMSYFLMELQRRAEGHERAIRALRRASHGPKPSRGWFPEG